MPRTPRTILTAVERSACAHGPNRKPVSLTACCCCHVVKMIVQIRPALLSGGLSALALQRPTLPAVFLCCLAFAVMREDASRESCPKLRSTLRRPRVTNVNEIRCYALPCDTAHTRTCEQRIGTSKEIAHLCTLRRHVTTTAWLS